MPEVSLFAFQMAEVIDSAKLIICVLALSVGILYFTRRTYIRKD